MVSAGDGGQAGGNDPEGTWDGRGLEVRRGDHNARTPDESIVTGECASSGMDVWSGASGEPMVKELPWDEREPEASVVPGRWVPLRLTCGQCGRSSGGGDVVDAMLVGAWMRGDTTSEYGFPLVGCSSARR